MKYIQLTLTTHPFNENITDMLSYHLGNIGYETFVATEDGLNAYIPQSSFSEQKIDELFQQLSVDVNHLLTDIKIEYRFNELEDENWNKKWEENYFSPLVVSDKCLVKSTFHNVEEHYEYEIVIDPKMAFGTGHHQTTYLMMQETLKLDLRNKSVLDIGCGTAVLAILASMMGAIDVVAIDFDEWAYQNAKENVLLNDISNVDVRLGEINLVEEEKFDIILANINRNILMQNIMHYSEAMNRGATLIMSGFYLEDVPILKLELQKHGLVYQKLEQRDNWTAIVCGKK